MMMRHSENVRTKGKRSFRDKQVSLRNAPGLGFQTPRSTALDVGVLELADSNPTQPNLVMVNVQLVWVFK